MSFWRSLVNTYDYNESLAGEQMTKTFRNGNSKNYMLLPLAHTTQTAQIEVTVTPSGEFYHAEVIEKEITVIPFTEASGSKAGSALKPHMLHDKLMYVAGDFVEYTGEEKKAEAFHLYNQQLKLWVDSRFSTQTVEAIYNYINKAQLIRDLVDKKVLFLEPNGKLMKKWTGHSDDKPAIFKQVVNEQSAAFVRFKVHYPNEVYKNPWLDQQLFKKYTRYYLSLERKSELCFVMGQKLGVTETHPNKLRNSGDMAKLISSNDKDGFTFRGRFKNASEAMSISYLASQKAHNALKWLIDRQGFTIDSRVYLLWGDQQLDLPSPNDELPDLDGLLIEDEIESYSNDHLAQNYHLMLQGISNQKWHTADFEMVHIVELDAATAGRMAVVNYRSLGIEDYMEKIKKWQKRMLWNKTYYNTKEKKWFHSLNTFTLRDIATSAYSPRADKEMVMAAISRLYNCVLAGAQIPSDLVRNLYVRCCMPQAYEKMEYVQLLQVSTVVFADKYNQEAYSMTLQQSNTNRSYLYGRLLAVADVFEERLLKESMNNRPTNALRYMTSFSNKPATVWKTIFTQLQPYFVKASTRTFMGSWTENDTIQKKITEIIEQFAENDFCNKALDEQFIIGYYNQRAFEYAKKGDK
ncbi:type I-C CRISPR-associated protein Cas8c/Csd1 [Kurthia sibirica]|uniref:Type I-C CRISPR-associated protein Cas8c/Csd1 n=1 Tax=Kurthia sibirica TaxID=202750 RepID=A0A2U3APH0_9BACL|nr:type I-C CRISPR-associated protein Cas8c/Csd1 [Kurthia sibirica]PWI26431.1 type I-C CRISPR-associated protein Cas8c/Csd1 [Kurthia sibirica]GEK32996.1 hypothetical protein KSI01_05290 [Kurthia sibirica]